MKTGRQANGCSRAEDLPTAVRGHLPALDHVLRVESAGAPRDPCAKAAVERVYRRMVQLLNGSVIAAAELGPGTPAETPAAAPHARACDGEPVAGDTEADVARTRCPARRARLRNR